MPSPSTSPLIDGPVLLPRQRYSDDRGWFEVLDDEKFNHQIKGEGVAWQQWNISQSRQGVLRGLHFQSPFPQAKLIRVVQGAVWDVVVDLRKGSPTYGKWQGYELSEDNPQSLYIPEDFAHGFLTTSPTATLIYAVNCARHAESEQIIRWDDPDLAIPWPVECPILSGRDAQASLWKSGG
jgi:dTDP-4-dehydrorhamnose 3,5-epimerase